MRGSAVLLPRTSGNRGPVQTVQAQGGRRIDGKAMFKTSLSAALLTVCLILATPAQSQGVSASVEPSAEPSSVQPDLSFDKDTGVDIGLTDDQTAEIGRI